MPARGLALLVVTLVFIAAAGGCGGASEPSYSTEEVRAHFQAEAGAQLFRKQGPGGDPAWEQLGLAEDASPALIERYGIFSIYVVERGEKEAMASLFRDKATKKPLAHRRGIYWELDTHSDTWTAHTRYANLVLVWFTEREQPAVDARWHRLHRMLRDLTTRSVARLFAATGDAIARLEDNSDGWRASLTHAGTGAQCLALDPSDAAVVYAGCRGAGLWKSDDAGEHWSDLSLPQADVFSVAVSPADGTVYAGCEPSMLFASQDGGRGWRELETLRALPSAPTWSFPPRPWTSHVRWIAPSPHEASLLLVGIELGGLMRSADGGETWEDHRPGAQPDVHALAWHPRTPARAYEAGGGGSAWSSDGGETWEPADEGRDRHYTWALAVDPEDPDCWFVSASPGPMQAHRAGTAQASLYRWRGQGPWEQLNGGLPQPLDAMPYALAWVEGRLLAGLADGTLLASRDRGDTWEKQPLSGDPLTRILALS